MCTGKPPPRRGSAQTAFRPRNKTLSGESETSSGLSYFGSRFFARSFSRRNTDVMTPLSSFPSEEWRQLFDRYDIENNGRMDGKIPVQVVFTQNTSVMACLVGIVI